MPTIVVILTFLAGNVILSWVEHEKSWITFGLNLIFIPLLRRVNSYREQFANIRANYLLLGVDLVESAIVVTESKEAVSQTFSLSTGREGKRICLKYRNQGICVRKIANISQRDASWTHSYLETRKRVIGKQCRTQTPHNVVSDQSLLFANRIYHQRLNKSDN